MSNNDYIIDIKNVTKKYGTNIVLNDVTVSFEKGKIHGLVGRNGSGKTMLMKCICGFVTPSSGEILINGIGIEEALCKDARTIWKKLQRRRLKRS